MNNPRVLLDPDPALYRATVKSPKSTEFPVDAIVTNSIIFVIEGIAPPANSPRVGLPHAVVDESLFA